MFKISVVIPVYNVDMWLADCLDSVLKQTLNDIEIICINDGSTDSSPDILRKYLLKDKRITIIDQENGGLSRARNAGIKASSGEYVYFLDSDDMIKENALELLYERAKSDDLDMLLFDASSFADKGVKLPEYSYERKNDYSTVQTGEALISALSLNNEYRPSACLYITKREFISVNGLSFMPNILHEDNIFTFASLMKAKRVSHVRESLYLRRYRENSIMLSKRNTAHVTGLFISYIEMLNIVSDSRLSDDYRDGVGRIVTNIFDSSVSEYALLDNESRSNLDWRGYKVYEPMFNALVTKLFDMYISEEALSVRKTPYKNDSLEKKLKGLINMRRGMLASVEGSLSFRIGRILTFPVRVPKNLLSAIRRDGFGKALSEYLSNLRDIRRKRKTECVMPLLNPMIEENNRLRAEVVKLTSAVKSQSDAISKLKRLTNAHSSDIAKVVNFSSALADTKFRLNSFITSQTNATKNMSGELNKHNASINALISSDKAQGRDIANASKRIDKLTALDEKRAAEIAISRKVIADASNDMKINIGMLKDDIDKVKDRAVRNHMLLYERVIDNEDKLNEIIRNSAEGSDEQ